MSLRTVALDTPSLRLRATRWDPTGSAVSMYSSTTARRIAALRSSSSVGSLVSFVAIGVDLAISQAPAQSRSRAAARGDRLECSPVSTRLYRVPGAVGRPASVHGALDHGLAAGRRHTRHRLVRDREGDDRAVGAEGGDSGVGEIGRAHV